MSISAIVLKGFGVQVYYLPTMGYGTFGSDQKIGPTLFVANQTTFCQSVANQITQGLSTTQTTSAGSAANQTKAD